MYKDCHVHTKLSHDGVSEMEDYLQIAREKGVDEITFTEHYDIYEGIKTDLTTIDVQKYFQYYQNLKQKYNNGCSFNFGIEIGLQPHIVATIKEMVRKYPFDFIIGSSHITCRKDISSDKSFFDGLSRKQAYMKYFEEVLNNIKLYDEFDVYGHLDYVVRYGGYDSKVIEYEEFADILDSILLELIKKDKGIEVNTSGIRYGLSTTHPNIEIIKRYWELGGKIITLGSDAHRTADLAKDFDFAYHVLESIGIMEIAVFHNRKPEFVKIVK